MCRPENYVESHSSDGCQVISEKIFTIRGFFSGTHDSWNRAVQKVATADVLQLEQPLRPGSFTDTEINLAKQVRAKDLFVEQLAQEYQRPSESRLG